MRFRWYCRLIMLFDWIWTWLIILTYSQYQQLVKRNVYSVGVTNTSKLFKYKCFIGKQILCEWYTILFVLKWMRRIDNVNMTFHSTWKDNSILIFTRWINNVDIRYHTQLETVVSIISISKVSLWDFEFIY